MPANRIAKASGFGAITSFKTVQFLTVQVRNKSLVVGEQLIVADYLPVPPSIQQNFLDHQSQLGRRLTFQRFSLDFFIRSNFSSSNSHTKIRSMMFFFTFTLVETILRAHFCTYPYLNGSIRTVTVVLDNFHYFIDIFENWPPERGAS